MTRSDRAAQTLLALIAPAAHPVPPSQSSEAEARRQRVADAFAKGVEAARRKAEGEKRLAARGQPLGAGCYRRKRGAR